MHFSKVIYLFVLFVIFHPLVTDLTFAGFVRVCVYIYIFINI